jgi:hypothetical protein
MKKIIALAALAAFLFSGNAYGQATVGSGGNVTVREVDGSPSVATARTIVFPNGSVTDSGSGVVTVVNSTSIDTAGTIGSKTWSDGSTDTFVWTFNRATGTDPTLTFGDAALTLNGDFKGANFYASGQSYYLNTAGTRWIKLGTGSPEGAATGGIGSLWLASDGTTGTTLWIKEAGTGNTGWVAVAAGGSGAPTTADYLVGTANGGLSAEIVVGTTPGGELGGTWASPTLDDSITVDSWTMTNATISSGTATVTTATVGSIVAEGATADDYETTIAFADPTASDKTATFPNRSGTVVLSGDTLTGDVTATLETDGTTATTIADSVTVTGWTMGASAATTPSAGDNDTSLATSAFVQTELDATLSGSLASPSTGTQSPTWSGPIRFFIAGGTATVNLPAAASYTGRAITFYFMGSYVITAEPNASEIIYRAGTAQTGGVSTTITGTIGQMSTLLSDGTSWVTLPTAATLAVGT